MKINIIRHVPPPTHRPVAIDVELFGMKKRKLHRPNSGELACVSFCINPDTVYIIDNKSPASGADDCQSLNIAFQFIKDAIWVFHNAKFDLMHLRRWVPIPPRKKVWDTMLMEKIMYGGYFDSYSLDDLARRYLNIRMDKSIRDKFESATELTDELLEYAALDASITLRIFRRQKEINEED